MSDEAPPWQRKLDHRLRALWARVAEQDRAHQSVRVFMRFTGVPEPLNLGAQIHAVSGDIASASLILSDLPKVASSTNVLFIELSQTLTPDQ